MRPETGITINETEEPSEDPDCDHLNFDPRKAQQEANNVKVYQCGGKFYAKVDDCEKRIDMNGARPKTNIVKTGSESIKLIERFCCSKHFSLKAAIATSICEAQSFVCSLIGEGLAR